MSKKTMIIIGCSFIGLIVLILVILWLMTLFRTTYYSYEKVEEKIVDATKKYFSDHPESLPTADGKYNLSYDVLVNGLYIAPLSELLKDGASCTANVIINKNDVDYTYIPKLDCGDNYSSIELYRQILNDNQIVTSGSGLYREIDGSYYFKGKVTNNYFVLGTNESNKDKEFVWQILGINKDNTVKIRAVKSTEASSVYDNRYNINKGTKTGYNTFEDSVMKDFLKGLEKNNKYFTAEEQSKLVPKQLCIGARSDKETINNGNVECSAYSIDKYLFGTLLPYEFLRASLDTNCKTVTDRSCENLNYLANQSSSEWSTTANSDSTHQLYAFYGTYYSLSSADNPKTLHLVANLNEFTFYKSGTGTLEDPYRVTKAKKH